MGQSGHNTKISKFRSGCRLPHELSSAGDGYAAPGPVRTYKLSPEELAYYGPVKPKSESQKKLEKLKKILPRDKLIDLINQGEKPKAIAKKFGLSYGTLYELRRAYGINTTKIKKMENIDKGSDKKMKTAMDRARELLPEQKLNELLAKGLNGKEISERFNLPYWTINELKKQYKESKTDNGTNGEAKKINKNLETDNYEINQEFIQGLSCLLPAALFSELDNINKKLGLFDERIARLEFANRKNNLYEFFAAVAEERKRQNGKWGVQRQPWSVWCVILGEEVGEVNKAALENRPEDLKKEIVQVAAVAAQIYEQLIEVRKEGSA